MVLLVVTVRMLMVQWRVISLVEGMMPHGWKIVKAAAAAAVAVAAAAAAVVVVICRVLAVGYTAVVVVSAVAPVGVCNIK